MIFTSGEDRSIVIIFSSVCVCVGSDEEMYCSYYSRTIHFKTLPPSPQYDAKNLFSVYVSPTFVIMNISIAFLLQVVSEQTLLFHKSLD